MTHSLIAQDNGVCIAQARFTPRGAGEVHVLALIGCTQYIDRVMPVADARVEYRRLRDWGWVVPQATPVLSERALRDAIHD
jgi:hypothetical protein